MLRQFFIAIASLLVLTAGYFIVSFLIKNSKADDVLVIEATYMQYACGDENDDMNVEKVDKGKYGFLVGRDIDPQVHLMADTYELKDYFYHNKTKMYGFTFRLKGRLSKYDYFGCDELTPKFWVEEIERLDGSNKITAAKMEIKWTAN